MTSRGDYEAAQSLDVGALIRSLLHGMGSSEQAESVQSQLRTQIHGATCTPLISGSCFSKEAYQDLL